MSKIIINYLLTAIVFFTVDMVWLGFIAKNLYRNYLGNLLSNQVNWPAAIIFYLLYIVGISFFAIYPAVSKGSVSSAILYGALFGFFAYATYDLTNLATLKDWPIQITFIDIAWGVILTSLVSTAGFYIVNFLK